MASTIHYDKIILGGGAAGCMAALAAAKAGMTVCIVEQKEMILKKLLLTGNGRCNITNTHLTKEAYNPEGNDYAMGIIEKFPPSKLMEWLEHTGLSLKDRDGYIYPYSNQAASVRDHLVSLLANQKVAIYVNSKILDGKKNAKGGYELHITTGEEEYRLIATHLILATGLLSHPKTGSDGSVFPLLEKLSLPLKKVLPALTSVECEEEYVKNLSGVRTEGCMKYGTVQMYESMGEIQFTEYGLSGIPMFQISRYVVQDVEAKAQSKQETNGDLRILVDLWPKVSIEDGVAFLQQKKKTMEEGFMSNYYAEQFFDGIVPKKVTNTILGLCRLKKNTPVERLQDKDFEGFVRQLKNLSFTVSGYRGYDFCQVCQGGVPTDALVWGTMECKDHPGLYVVGELVDVDGICGGYNLQWAFASGMIAGSKKVEQG